MTSLHLLPNVACACMHFLAGLSWRYFGIDRVCELVVKMNWSRELSRVSEKAWLGADCTGESDRARGRKRPCSVIIVKHNMQ